MKLCSRIQNFPILNDVNALGLLKKFRTDISYYQKFKGMSGYEMKPPIIPPTSNENNAQMFNPNSNLSNSNTNDLTQLQSRNAFLEKENQRLEQALRESDQEKASLLQTIAAMKNRGLNENNFNPMNQMGGMPPPFLGDKYDVSDKLLHIEDDINETNQIMAVVNKLNERFKTLEDERKSLAEEVERLRVENQNLTNEMNKIQNELNSAKTNFDNENFNLKELLNSTKNELDYMRNEAEKYRKIQAD